MVLDYRVPRSCVRSHHSTHQLTSRRLFHATRGSPTTGSPVPWPIQVCIFAGDTDTAPSKSRSPCVCCLSHDVMPLALFNDHMCMLAVKVPLLRQSTWALVQPPDVEHVLDLS
jgi:hypothetical protein